MLAEDIAAMAAGRRELPAYDRHMGFRLTRWEPTGATVEVDADVAGRFANPTGVLHGGVLCGLADSAMGLTVSGLVGEGETCTNTDLQLRFLKAVPPEGGADGAQGGGHRGHPVLRATARVVRRGRRVVAMEADVWSGADLVARASSTFLVLERRGA